MFVASAVRSSVRRNGAASITSRDPLTIDQIAHYAPSVLAESKHVSRSARYTYVPTIQIVEHLQQNGYGIFGAMQSGSRDADRRGHTKHLLRFRPLNQTLTVGGTYPEMVLINSHDGTSAYRLMAGTFRLVCTNGLIVSDSLIDDVRVHHKGNILEDVSDAVIRMRDSLPRIGQGIERFQNVSLSPVEREIFARAALTAKYGTDEESPVPAAQIVQPRRIEDREPTLWNTLNTVQESLIRGGHRYTLRTDRGIQRRSTNPVNSVDGTTAINRAVWQLAEEMAKLKA